MEYQCVAKTRDGKTVNRLISADNPSFVVSRLKEEGLLPVKVVRAKLGGAQSRGRSFFSAGRVKPKELAVVTRQLGVTLTAGLLLTEALDAVSDDLENKYFRGVIEKIRYEVQCGADFSTALEKYPKIFSPTYRAIVKVGEATGRLHETLTNLAKYLEDFERLKEKIKSGVRYPLFVLGFAAVVMVIMIFFLIPQFAGMFSEFGAKLPLLTRIVIGLSEFCVKHVLWFAAGFIAVWFLSFYLMKFERVRYGVDVLKTKIPIIGKNIIHKALLSRYCRTLGFLLSAGVSLKASLDITARVVDHLVMAEAIDQVNVRVVAGSSLSGEMRKRRIFSGLSARMTSVGERTGRLSEMLERTAQYYEDELETTIQNLTTLLEPVLIIFVGANVLIVVLALYLPIFHLSTAIR